MRVPSLRSDSSDSNISEADCEGIRSDVNAGICSVKVGESSKVAEANQLVNGATEETGLLGS